MRLSMNVLWLLFFVFLATEISFRIYLYGVAALSPWHMNSYTEIHDSGLVQPAIEPEIVYELRPNLNTLYKGMPFRTNSVGIRDQEYALVKPASTFRIAVLGSSWEMGSGVTIEDTWHTQLEDILNHQGDGRHYEVLNFGVDQYGFGEIIATLEHKVHTYSPDLVLVALTYFTPVLLWSDPPEVYKAYPRRNPFFELHSLRVVDKRQKLGLYPPDNTMRKRATADGMLTQRKKAAERFLTYADIHNTPVVVLKLAYQAGWSRNPDVGDSEFRDRPDLHYFDVTEQIRGSGYKPKALRVSEWDGHPNALAHKLMADAIYGDLTTKGLLPDSGKP
jgi:hypothetical protein